MNSKTTKNIPITAIVVFNNGAYGGAPKRYTNLFIYLNKLYPGKFYYIVNRNLYNQLRGVYNELPDDRIKIVDLKKEGELNQPDTPANKSSFIKNSKLDPIKVNELHTIFRKVYWYYKNKFRQREIFEKIEKLRSELNIKVFYGVFAGVLPLVFYLDESPRRAAVVFSDMDSWFSDVLSDIKKLWYRKYYSFNYALENCDVIDFLSPYIYDGVKERGVKLNENSIHISPNSFADYSKCSSGNKGEDSSRLEIAFCARLEPDKNPILYLEAAKEILKKYPAIKFHLLGEGMLENEIKNFIDSNNISSSINFGFHTNPPEIFRQTSVFVSLQSNTNYPSQSVLEAMACGNAVIASNRGDTKLLINDSNGILVDLNVNEIISALEKLINNPKMTFEMGKRGRESVLNQHTIEKYRDYFLSLIKEAEMKIGV